MQEDKKVFNQLLELCVSMFVGLIVFYVVITFVGQITAVNGNSMNQTLQDGNQLIVNKLSYHLGKPKRFDIVVFPMENGDESIYCIKRIIGLPGETVQILDGKIYIDGEELEDAYGYYSDGQLMNGYDFEEEQELEPEEYFVLGDNRNHSLDSRKFGCIQEDDILGKAVFRIYPFSDFGLID